jgi:transposase InsO family protein
MCASASQRCTLWAINSAGGPYLNLPQKLGAPGLDFQTWERRMSEALHPMSPKARHGAPIHLGLVRPGPPANPSKQAGLIFHSDRGSQYASDDFRKVLEHCSITPSMSRKGNCWDNACSETLFGSLKVERLHGQRFETIRDAKDAVIAWLLWYNQTRMHSTLKYVSPVQFEQDWTDATMKIAA